MFGVITRKFFNFYENKNMKNTSFLEELERRLNDLEKEISKIAAERNRKDLVMENLIHNFDEAMDRTAASAGNEFKTGVGSSELYEKNLRFLDF